MVNTYVEEVEACAVDFHQNLGWTNLWFGGVVVDMEFGRVLQLINDKGAHGLGEKMGGIHRVLYMPFNH